LDANACAWMMFDVWAENSLLSLRRKFRLV